ncbi:MAG: hypothetical protein ACREXX_10045, partial [Gammaproteobacteria bacterium]
MLSFPVARFPLKDVRAFLDANLDRKGFRTQPDSRNRLLGDLGKSGLFETHGPNNTQFESVCPALSFARNPATEYL